MRATPAMGLAPPDGCVFSCSRIRSISVRMSVSDSASPARASARRTISRVRREPSVHGSGEQLPRFVRQAAGRRGRFAASAAISGDRIVARAPSAAAAANAGRDRASDAAAAASRAATPRVESSGDRCQPIDDAGAASAADVRTQRGDAARTMSSAGSSSGARPSSHPAGVGRRFEDAQRADPGGRRRLPIADQRRPEQLAARAPMTVRRATAASRTIARSDAEVCDERGDFLGRRGADRQDGRSSGKT